MEQCELKLTIKRDSSVEGEEMIRVKLYVLNENRQWDDKGKGYVSVAPKSSLDPVTSSTTTTTSQSTTDDVPEAKIDPKPTSTTEIDDENAPGTSTDSLSAFTVEGIERDKCPGTVAFFRSKIFMKRNVGTSF